MNKNLRQELELLILALVIALALGALFGQAVLALLITVLCYLAWTIYNLNHLIQWLNKPSKNVPESSGVWDTIFKNTYQQYQRQRKSKRKLASMLTRFQASTRALPYSTIVLNNLDEIEWFNPAARQLFNLRDKEDIGQNIINLIRNPAFANYLKKRDFNKQLEFTFRDASLIISITAYGKGQSLVIARDITDRKHVDAMRRDFIANASHELRTPITVISGFLEILHDQAPDNLVKPIESIQKQTERMQRLLLELLELAKLESEPAIEDPQEVNLNDILEDIFTDAQALDNQRHDLCLNTDQNFNILGSPEELCIAFSNLLTNAIRYTPDEGKIRVFTEEREGHVCVCVQDEGIGIEAEHISRLTERFYRVDPGRSREQGGTGLGLAIVKHILERHNGRLVVESEPGEGSLFRCCFPPYRQ